MTVTQRPSVVGGTVSEVKVQCQQAPETRNAESDVNTDFRKIFENKRTRFDVKICCLVTQVCFDFN